MFRGGLATLSNDLPLVELLPIMCDVTIKAEAEAKEVEANTLAVFHLPQFHVFFSF